MFAAAPVDPAGAPGRVRSRRGAKTRSAHTLITPLKLSIAATTSYSFYLVSLGSERMLRGDMRSDSNGNLTTCLTVYLGCLRETDRVPSLLPLAYSNIAYNNTR